MKKQHKFLAIGIWIEGELFCMSRPFKTEHDRDSTKKATVEVRDEAVKVLTKANSGDKPDRVLIVQNDVVVDDF